MSKSKSELLLEKYKLNEDAWKVGDIARVKSEGSSAGIQAYRGQEGKVIRIDYDESPQYIWLKMDKDGSEEPFTEDELE